MAAKLQIALTFDEFGWSELEDRARAEGLRLDRLVALACSYFASELDAGRTAIIAPRFGLPPVERVTRTLALELDPGSLRRLEREAERQGRALRRLVEHAAVLYLADLEAGRVAERIAERAGP